MTPSTAVVVVSYGSHDLLARNLVQVSEELPDLIVVVVDNFTTAAETVAVQLLCATHGWELVASPTNTGYGVGNNLGVAAARNLGAGQFLLLNPDATIDRSSFEALSAQVQREPLTLVGPVVRTETGATWSDGVDLLLDRGRMRATRKRPATGQDGPAVDVIEWLSGACLLVSDQLWQLVGGFDPDYFLYWEDVDLSHRVQRVGGRVEVVREASAVHAEGGTPRGAGRRSPVEREPDNEVNRALGDEVGASWIQLYAGDQPQSTDLEAALSRLEQDPCTGRPDLSGRDWDKAAASHLAAYRRALKLRRRTVGAVGKAC